MVDIVLLAGKFLLLALVYLFLLAAVRAGIGLKTIGDTIHPYPTHAEAIRKLGDQYNRTRLTPFVAGLFKKWLAWSR